MPGRVKTRLCPPCRPEEAAEIAAAALADTLDAVPGCSAERRVLALDGEPGRWLPAGFEVIRSSGDGLAERLGAAWAEVDGPCVQIGMDTPQVAPALPRRRPRHRVRRPTSALGPGDRRRVVGDRHGPTACRRCSAAYR